MKKNLMRVLLILTAFVTTACQSISPVNTNNPKSDSSPTPTATATETTIAATETATATATQSTSPSQTVTVDVASVLNEVSTQKIGINTNYWMDNQALRANGARTLPAALKDIGVTFMRYPGGEKSDGYLWSTPPYKLSNPRLARISAQDWPSNDAGYWSPPGDVKGTWSRPIYDFDVFMADCRDVGAEPVLVVAYDGIYKEAYPNGVSLTKEQALAAAVAWVKYANITKKYNIKYWTLGNETWMDNNYMGDNPGSAQYGLDASEFAKAMKTVDPTIKVGINGNSTAMFDGALANCKDDIDFLDVHGYPAYGYLDYDSYLAKGVYFTSSVDVAQAAIEKLEAGFREKLFIVNTETSANTFGGKGNWIENDTGHGLVNTEIFLQCLNDNRLKFSLFWNTHWIDNNKDIFPSENDAFDKYNQLTAQGLSLKLINSNLLKQMVKTSSVSPVFSSATYDPDNDKLTLFLINRDKKAAQVTVKIENYQSLAIGEKWVYGGDSSGDIHPSYIQGEDANIENNQTSIILDPVSVTVINLNGKAP